MITITKRSRTFAFAAFWLLFLYICVRVNATLFVVHSVSAGLYLAFFATILFLPLTPLFFGRKWGYAAMFVGFVTMALPVVLTNLPPTIAESLAYSIDDAPPADIGPSGH